MPLSVVNTGNAFTPFSQAMVGISTALSTAGYCISDGVISLAGVFGFKNVTGNLKYTSLHQVLSTAGTLSTGLVRMYVFGADPGLSLNAGDVVELGLSGTTPIGYVDFDSWVAIGSYHSICKSNPDLPIFTDSNETDLNILLVTKDANWALSTTNTLTIKGVNSENS